MAPADLSKPIILTDPLVLAGAAIAVGYFGARYWRERNRPAHFLVQCVVFAVLTGLMMTAGIVPYKSSVVPSGDARRLFANGLEVVWWLAAAWLVSGFLRAFLYLGRRQRESKLVQDLLSALIYLVAGFAIVGYVFDLPLKGLLATSGVLAIVIGLALQSSLADVFSGIVLNIERPYRVGDWIILDDDVQGKVIETNWRATHLLTGRQDVAIVPNSVIAKSKLVNCSTPTEIHGSSIRVKLDRTLSPAVGRSILNEALLGTTHIMRAPEPTVTVKDISAESIEFELSYSVADVGAVNLAQNELFDRIYRTAGAAGTRFAPRLAPFPKHDGEENRAVGPAERLLAGVSLFTTLTPEEKTALAAQMRRKEYKPGEILVTAGTILQALSMVSRGVLVASAVENGEKTEIIRLVRGDYFGELGLLAGESLNGEITALTRVVIYEICKDALSPLLQARPSMVEELSDSVASRRMARQTVLDHLHHGQHQTGVAIRVAANIRRLFALH